MADETADQPVVTPRKRQSKVVYAFDPESFQLLGPTLAWESPEDKPGVFHMPASTTDVAPSGDLPAGNVWVWNQQNSWIPVRDARGLAVYSKDTGAVRVLSELGDVPTGFTELKPATALDKWNGQAWVSPASQFDTWNGNAFITDMPRLKQWRSDQITAEESARADALGEGYIAAEIATWPQQFSEATAYTANANAPTPLLGVIAKSRGLSVAELAAKVLAKAQPYQDAVVGIIARQRERLDAVDAATTAAAVLAA